MLEIHQEPADRTTIQLSPHEGEMIRSLIVKTTNIPFNRYVEKVGLQVTNVVNYLSGRNRISLAILAKLLAGTNLHLQCQLQVMITSGNGVVVADSTQLEEMLYSHELDTVELENITTPSPSQIPIPKSCSLEKLPEGKRITPEYPSKGLLAEYSTQFLDTLTPTSDTGSPTSSPVDQPPKTSEETQSTENPPLQK